MGKNDNGKITWRIIASVFGSLIVLAGGFWLTTVHNTVSGNHERTIRLEEDVKHIKDDVGDIQTEQRALRTEQREGFDDLEKLLKEKNR